MVTHARTPASLIACVEEIANIARAEEAANGGYRGARMVGMSPLRREERLTHARRHARQNQALTS